MTAARLKKCILLSSAALLCLILAISLPISALGASLIDTDASCTLTVQDAYEGNALEGVAFSVFRAAEVSGGGVCTLTGDFALCGVSLGDLHLSSQWNEAAQSLADWASAHDLTPAASAATDRSGTAVFSGLPTGLYLVVGETATLDGVTYGCDPALILLPNQDALDGEWNYEVTIEPKNEAYSAPPSTPTDPSAPTEPTDADTPTETTGGDTSTEPASPTVPQTGQLNWPIPVLTLCGGGLLALGLYLVRRKGKKSNG